MIYVGKQSNFHDWVEQAMHKPFVWGQWDCALMVADYVRFVTGEHPRPDLIGAYSTPLGAYRVINSNGGLSGICDDKLCPTDVGEAKRGDVVLGKFGRKETLMVCTTKYFLAMSGGSAALVSRDEVTPTRAWRVE